MTTIAPAMPPRNLPRSAAAVLAAFFAVLLLSIGTDQLMHSLGIYPPWGEPMHETSDNLLALAYRIIYTIIGGYLAARLAPRNPVRHALVLGGVGTVIALAGAIATIPMDLGPAWFPVSLVIVALPCSWLGAWFYRSGKLRTPAFTAGG